MSDRNKEAGRKRWDGISKEDRIAHIRKMVEARVNRVIQCPNCEHEFMVNKGLIIAPETKPEVAPRPIVKVEVSKPPRAVSSEPKMQCVRHRIPQKGCWSCPT